MKHDTWIRAARHAGRELGSAQLELLDAYSNWLTSEAITSGGIGPSEVGRVEGRHVGDSLTFASPLPPSPGIVWDLGSGVGLPGIPLAILLPKTDFRLIDRSGRRVELIRRVVRILDLPNVEVEQTDIATLRGVDLAVSRAALPPEEMARSASIFLRPGGMLVQGGSWREKPLLEGWDTEEIPRSVLDYPVWLLIMRRR